MRAVLADAAAHCFLGALTMKNRSRIHMLNVAAARLEEDCANPKLVEDLRLAAKELSRKRAQGRDWTDDEMIRVEQQRTLFTMLGDGHAAEKLKETMMQRAYDLISDGDGTACDAILEFLPSKDSDAVLNGWMSDQDNKSPKSRWH